jgi:hypothetical protein
MKSTYVDLTNKMLEVFYFKTNTSRLNKMAWYSKCEQGSHLLEDMGPKFYI